MSSSSHEDQGGLAIEWIISVTRRGGIFRWFRSNRDFWVLDYRKWSQDFLDAGYQLPEEDPSERFGIPVVNEATADRFFAEMRRFEISKGELGEQLAARIAVATSYWDVIDLFPIVYVDFDFRHCCACYPEGTRMERYIPDGWTGEFEDFL